MALHRGIQSAIFYYVSCAPCAEARYRKKRKQEAKKDRAEREALEAELPDLYRHPSPSSTNPHWQAEIALGPTRLRGKRKVTTVENPRVAIGGSQTSGAPSCVDLPPGSENRINSQWQQEAYQREDEELWGSTASLDKAQIQRPPTAKLKDSAQPIYKDYRNPPVNDRHPAIVTKVSSREDVAWMLQPPPLPAVMSGKQPPPKPISMAGSSRLSPHSLPMSRQASSISERMLATSEKPRSLLSRGGSRRTSAAPTVQRYARDARTDERDFALDPSPEPGSTDEPVAKVPTEPKAVLVRRQSRSNEHLLSEPKRQQDGRPPLWTVMTDSAVQHSPLHGLSTSSESSLENSHPAWSERREQSPRLPSPFARHSAMLVQDKSFRIVQDLTSGAPALKVFTTNQPTKDGGPVLRHAGDEGGDDDATLTSALRPELFDSWYTPDFELPKWVHEHTKREVRERWSMDF